MVLILVVFVIVLIMWFVSTSNTINRSQLKMDEAKSGIEIQLRKRYDTLTESMNIAKGYAKHEKELFTNLRKVNSGMSVEDINDCVKNQNQCMSRFMALGESYPELKSSELFMNLQRQLSEENAQFAAAKRAFNSNVTSFNNLVVSFPSSAVCAMKGVSKSAYVQEEDVDQLKSVDMSWN